VARIRFTTAGESHGPGLVAVVEGMPAGLGLTPDDLVRAVVAALPAPPA